jgi:hypothetical protein
MLLIYWEAQRNAREACRVYKQRFPKKRHPAHIMLPRLERHLRETDSLSPNKHPYGNKRRCYTSDFEEVIQRFEEKPDTSTQSIAHTLGVNHMSVWQVLHDEHLYPLPPPESAGDGTERPHITFCQWMLRQIVQVPNFLALPFFLMSVPLPTMAFSTPETAMCGLRKILARSICEATNTA